MHTLTRNKFIKFCLLSGTYTYLQTVYYLVYEARVVRPNQTSQFLPSNQSQVQGLLGIETTCGRIDLDNATTVRWQCWLLSRAVYLAVAGETLHHKTACLQTIPGVSSSRDTDYTILRTTTNRGVLSVGQQLKISTKIARQ